MSETPKSARQHPLAALDWSHAHRAEIQMRYGDTDAMGHLNNATYVSYLETARVQMLAEMGTPLHDLLTVVAHIEVDYISEIKLGQQVIVETLVEGLGTSSYTFVVRVLADGVPSAYARTVQVNIGPDKRPAPLAPDRREWMERFMAGQPSAASPA
ncbi:acyl-CoA thioesterase [Deinococcus sp. Marseille-Q6407]|uniref:acyl-CoA thioesterase n=1 Tax=Deinococcus sp. Marseille-Q6407 TaxID=2969223 RepID=UPI0021C0815A|nr:thioesterase family protein [Deinococcus sp. Marseille-Q6407]